MPSQKIERISDGEMENIFGGVSVFGLLVTFIVFILGYDIFSVTGKASELSRIAIKAAAYDTYTGGALHWVSTASFWDSRTESEKKEDEIAYQLIEDVKYLKRLKEISEE